MTTLHTERLVLRPWTLHDLEAFHAIWGDERVIWWGPSKSLETSRAFLIDRVFRRTDPSRGTGWFAMTREGAIVGNVILQPAAFAPELEIGWHVAHEKWGHGYATEGARAVLAHAFEVVRAKRIVAAIVPENVRSRHVAERLKMRRIANVMHAGLLHDLFAIDAHTT